MTKPAFFFVFLLFCSCNNSSTGNEAIVNTSDSTSVIVKDTFAAAGNNNSSPQSDSIDKANAATIEAAKDDINKATVSLKDSLLFITSDKYRDHRFFGYAQPDNHSKKIILFSIYTGDVEGNPFKCTYGAYYQTSDLNNTELKYIGDEGAFAKFAILKNNTPQDTVYIEKKWITFE